MLRLWTGAALLIGGVAAFIEAHSHRPRILAHSQPQVEAALELEAEGRMPPKTGLSQTAYDLLRIGGWALVIVGVLLIAVGLIAYLRRAPS